jgi:putative ABC transport system permease protein
MFSDLLFRVRALFSRGDMERELDDELRFHLEQETEKHVRAGVPRPEAERRARIAFGGADRIKEDARDARGVEWIDSLLQDLRYAWRGLRSRPGFTAGVVVTLGLSVGANAAMFGIVDRLLFRAPYGLIDQDRVHRVFVRYLWDGREQVDNSFAYKRYDDFRRLTRSFETIVALGERRLAIGVGPDAREMNVGAVSATLFDLYHVRPELGRFFTPAEDTTPAGATVTVLSYGFWKSRYGGATNVLGQSVHIGEQVYTIIGVAPENFGGIPDNVPPAVFVPITTFASSRSSDYYQNYDWSWMEMLVRRKPEVSLAGATADLTAAFAASWSQEFPDTRRFPTAAAARARAEATPIHMARGPGASRDSRVAKWVMGVAVIVLLVACANVANLLLARAVSRRREIALRLALGVTRGRLVRQLITESLLIAALGGATGVMLAQWGGRTLRTMFLGAEDTGGVADARTLIFLTIATLAVALITGVAPALHALRGDVASSLKAGTREGTYRRSRTRTALLLFQGALSVVLLVGAGLFVRSLSNVRSIPLGYDVDPIVYLDASPRGVELSREQQNELADRMVAAARTVPGVENATLTVSVPFRSSEGRGPPKIPGRDSLQRLGRFTLQAGSPSYFATFGTRILAGRGISDADRAGSPPVVVVNDAMAKALWPDESAIGKQLRIGNDTMPFLTVVGVAENIRGFRLSGSEEFWYYLPIEQYKRLYGAAYLSVLVRVNGHAENYVEALRRRLQQEMPGASYVRSNTMRELLAPRQRAWEFGATMFVAFGGLALVLAAIGLYSVIAYAVVQRTHELGVRIALGAGQGDVMRMILGQGLAFALAGITIGSLIAFWAGRWVEPLLFSQKARDPLVFVAVATVLLVVAVAAAVRPAVRAMRVDPTVALRSD